MGLDFEELMAELMLDRPLVEVVMLYDIPLEPHLKLPEIKERGNRRQKSVKSTYDVKLPYILY